MCEHRGVCVRLLCAQMRTCRSPTLSTDGPRQVADPPTPSQRRCPQLPHPSRCCPARPHSQPQRWSATIPSWHALSPSWPRWRPVDSSVCCLKSTLPASRALTWTMWSLGRGSSSSSSSTGTAAARQRSRCVASPRVSCWSRLWPGLRLLVQCQVCVLLDLLLCHSGCWRIRFPDVLVQHLLGLHKCFPLASHSVSLLMDPRTRC
jgi:hypothetical protein